MLKRKFAGQMLGVWVVSILLLLVYLTDRPLYQAMVDAGEQMYSCVDWDASGHVVPGVCVDPPPAWSPGQ